MAKSGAAMIMVENASITASGSGFPRTIRCNHNRYLKGIETLADTIHREKSLAGLQINHAGRFAHVSESVAPSAIPVIAAGRISTPLKAESILSEKNAKSENDRR
jgi:2,4-dienoyl-CoA reductase-like NADH-dependent reductase (Old Yellow Enzyme family)